MFVKLEISEAVFATVKQSFSNSFEEDYYVKYPKRAGLPETVEPELEDALGVFEDGDKYRVIRCGYYITKDCARYTTSRGNTWGVVKTPSGEYQAFYVGRRSRARDLEMMLMNSGIEDPSRLVVVEYRTTGPVGMKWWQRRGEYLLELDDLSLASAIAVDKDEMDREVQPPIWWLDVACGLDEARRARVEVHTAAIAKARAGEYRRRSAMGM